MAIAATQIFRLVNIVMTLQVVYWLGRWIQKAPTSLFLLETSLMARVPRGILVPSLQSSRHPL